MNPTLRFAGSLVGALVLSGAAVAQVHAPIQPSATVVRDVLLSTSDDAVPQDIIMQGGRIVSIQATGGDLPAGARVFEGKGMFAQASWIDAWTTEGVTELDPVIDQDLPVEVDSDVRTAMRAANRKGVAPLFRAADVVDFGADGAGAWRAEGFGTLLAAPDGDLLSGHGVLMVTRAGARRDLILSPEVFQFGQFNARGRGFPSTLMGYFSQLRQFFYDAERQADWQARYESGEAVPRPVWDPALMAGTKLLGGRELYVVQADRADHIERWIRLAEEFNLRIAIAGGRDAWKHAALLAELKIPVILTMELGDEADDPNAPKDDKKGSKGKAMDKAAPEEMAADTTDDAEGAVVAEGADGSAETDPDDADENQAVKADEPVWFYEVPKAEKVEERRKWEERRDNAQRLHEAGVRILFATGDRKPKEFMADLRKALDAGLDAEFVRTALTSDAALFLGLNDHLGTLDAGRNATLSVWTSDPLAKEAGDIAMIVVDGIVHEFEVQEPGTGPDEGIDATGTWLLTIEDAEFSEAPKMMLEMDDEGRVTGTYVMVDDESGETLESAVSGSVSGKTLQIKGTVTMGPMDIKFTAEMELNGDSMSGDSTLEAPWGAETAKMAGTRAPKIHHHDLADEHYSCSHSTEEL